MYRGPKKMETSFQDVIDDIWYIIYLILLHIFPASELFIPRNLGLGVAWGCDIYIYI